jgi:transketolase
MLMKIEEKCINAIRCLAIDALEAASPQGWCEWVGDQGKVIRISEFGSSAP